MCFILQAINIRGTQVQGLGQPFSICKAYGRDLAITTTQLWKFILKLSMVHPLYM